MHRLLIDCKLLISIFKRIFLPWRDGVERIYSEVLYDSDNDGKESSVFREKVMKHSQLHFIVVDSDNNVFGHYHPGVIGKCGSLPQGYNYDANMF